MIELFIPNYEIQSAGLDKPGYYNPRWYVIAKCREAGIPLSPLNGRLLEPGVLTELRRPDGYLYTFRSAV